MDCIERKSLPFKGCLKEAVTFHLEKIQRTFTTHRKSINSLNTWTINNNDI